MKILALFGRSGSGKTTAIESLIELFVGRGLSVGAIKHTHHALNTDDRGDTRRFRRAGANPVILAGDGEAVIFDGDGVLRVEYGTASDLVERFQTDLLFIEGFRGAGTWPSVELAAGHWKEIEELAALVESPLHG
ncbi:MAG TPA: molybdopterin-guanine dinucleotide biosynthesis protein MobB [Thermoanaerobaculia bacterium]|nr:molybdopterin-guanine dinucleotide biosynthesis protein MobB [Thermoanaerobaculia bacterium]